MAYKRINIMDVYEIIRRWHSGQTKSEIARALCYDRKTVRKYIKRAIEKGLDRSKPLPRKADCLSMLEGIEEKKSYQSPVLDQLIPHKEELMMLMNQKPNPLKAKTAFEVIKEKYRLEVSYSTFKRFYQQYNLGQSMPKISCRIEPPAGKFFQVDYAKVGRIYDPTSQRNRDVYVFLGSLRYSRHKFAEFTFKPDKENFINCHIHAFEYFGGAPEIWQVDNLKSGVIRADIYDPKLNHTYQELAEHYGCFIDPCRVRKPKDKGQVERDVQTIREQFRRLLALHPDLTLAYANVRILDWLKKDYGMRAHGTTNQKPYEVFMQVEKSLLKPLPVQNFQFSTWKEAKVHPDCFVQYKKKFYGVPFQYVGRKVWIKEIDNKIEIYFNHKLIKHYFKQDQLRQYDIKDFPENIRAVLDHGYHKQLLKKAEKIGYHFYKLISILLKSHAFLNLRKAQAIMRLAEKMPKSELNKIARQIIFQKQPINLEIFKLNMKDQSKKEKSLIGPNSEEFIREASYFSKHNERS